jgi:hypothetical protein
VLYQIMRDSSSFTPYKKDTFITVPVYDMTIHQEKFIVCSDRHIYAQEVMLSNYFYWNFFHTQILRDENLCKIQKYFINIAT